MTLASTYGLTTPRADDWRGSAACRNEDTEVFFKSPDLAKTFCDRCPVTAACLRFALANSITYGVFGGLTYNERRGVRRREIRATRNLPLKAEVLKLPPPKTLREAFDRRTEATDDGHIRWLGSNQFKFKAERHLPLRTAFLLGHGREPEGTVRRSCRRNCVLPAHLTDAVLRDAEDLCGTVPGYNRHLRRGEETCAPCRRANADADNRLRRTGTTKVSA
ncbi:WhiB family transcriptional regulator [Streptomyces scabiei]|uniref:WhiB family transcriptional regulator n=1 Tax=Streptomyces scabiei TaxID=1930 RepID=UPI0038D4DA8E